MSFQDPSKSSGLLSSSGSALPAAMTAAGSQIKSGVLTNVQAIAGSAAATIMVYDGVDNTGLLLVSLAGVPTGTTQFANIANGIIYEKGLYVSISGTGAGAVVHYTSVGC